MGPTYLRPSTSTTPRVIQHLCVCKVSSFYSHKKSPPTSRIFLLTPDPHQLALSLLSSSHELRRWPAMPSPLRNGDHIMSAASQRKIRCFGALHLVLRLAAFCFCLAAAVFAATDASALRRLPFRLVLATNAIIAVYSLFEIGAAVSEMLRGATLMPEAVQLWFDFVHDQVFGYMVLAAGAAGAREAALCDSRLVLREEAGGSSSSSTCVQAYIAVGLGFAGFAFQALAALVSGFRLVCFLATGSRFPSTC